MKALSLNGAIMSRTFYKKLGMLPFKKMIIALLPFRYPTIVDTDYFGGIDTHI